MKIWYWWLIKNIVFESWTCYFLLNVVVPFLVSLQNVLEISQHSFETLPVNRSHSASVNCFDACLSINVMKKSKFSKIISFFVLINNSWELILSLFLFCYKVTFQHNVKLITFFALLDNILTIFIFLFFQHIIKLFPVFK